MKNTDLPASPCDLVDFQPNTGDQVIREQFTGLSKREAFTKAAMEVIPHMVRGADLDMYEFAAACVQIGDAVLAELERTKTK